MKISVLTISFAFGYLIGPHADACFAIVSETRGALIPGCFSVPTIPKYIAFGFIGENTVETFAVIR